MKHGPRFALLVALLVALPGALPGALSTVPAAQEPAPDAVESAIAAGLDSLARAQTADGGWPAPSLRAHDRFADTALAALALHAAGERLDGGKHHPALRDAVRFLEARIPERGPIRVDRPRGGDWERFESWYAAFAGLALAEVHAVTPGPDSARAMASLARRLAHLQKPRGGYCHDLEARVRQIPGLGRAEYADDLAAAGSFCIAALHAIARHGVPIDRERLARSVDWLAALQNADGGVQYGSGHSWPDAMLSEPGRSAGALWCLTPILGATDPRCRALAAYVDRGFDELPKSAGHGGKEFVVSHLTGMLACRAAGDDAAARYRAAFAPELARRQRDDGRFVLGNGAWDTPANNTAVAVLCLLGPDAQLAQIARPAAGDAADAGARWLRGRRAADGSWDGKWGDRHVDLALTALAARALLAADPLGGRHAARASTRWLAAALARPAEAASSGRQRSHLGFQLPLALQLFAALPAESFSRDGAVRAIREIARAQSNDGGFGYDAGELYTLCVATSGVAIALADAVAAGLEVPATVLARALDYLEACAGPGGGFRYCPDPTHPILAKDRARYLREEVGRTLGAVAALARGGRGDRAACRAGVAFLARELTVDALPADDRYLWFHLLWGQGARALLDAATAQRLDRCVDARLAEMQDTSGAFAWPGIAWSAALGRPPMFEVFATAAGTLLAAERRPPFAPPTRAPR